MRRSSIRTSLWHVLVQNKLPCANVLSCTVTVQHLFPVRGRHLPSLWRTAYTERWRHVHYGFIPHRLRQYKLSKKWWKLAFLRNSFSWRENRQGYGRTVVEVVLSITESCFRKANFKIRRSIDRERVMFTMIISVVVLPFTGTVCRIRYLSRTLVGLCVPLAIHL